MAKLVEVLNKNEVEQLIQILEAYKDKEVSICGFGLPIHVYEEGNYIILDEGTLDSLEIPDNF